MSLLQKGAINRIGAKVPPLFEENFVTGDFSKWDYVVAEYGEYADVWAKIVETPVKCGSYSAELWNAGNQFVNPSITKVLAQKDPLYSRAYVYIPKYPRAGFRIMFASVGRYVNWFTSVAYVAFANTVAGEHYWNFNATNLTDTDYSINTWYLVEIMASPSLNQRKLWVDGELLKTQTYSGPSYLNAIEVSLSPTWVYPGLNHGFYIDCIKASEVGPIG